MAVQYSNADGFTFDNSVLLGDTANASVTQGLTLNQGANDDEILSLKSSDVAHGLTTITETDTYGRLLKQSATLGGLRVAGISDGDGAGLELRGIIGAADPTDTTPAVEQAAATAARTAKKAEIVAALTAVNPLPEMPEAEA